jgi:glutaconate CoA-transferase subunit A
MPVAGHVGSDYERLRPDFRVIANPWEPAQRVLLVPAIRCDVALLHAIAAAPDGTLLLDPVEDDALLAQASRVVIASAEQLTTVEAIQQAGEGVVLPGIHVTAVVELPGGAHPTMVRGVYPLDADHLAVYVAAAADDDAFRIYLERYVAGPTDGAAAVDAGRRAAAPEPLAPGGPTPTP